MLLQEGMVVTFSYTTKAGETSQRYGRIESVHDTHLVLWDYTREDYRSFTFSRINGEIAEYKGE